MTRFPVLSLPALFLLAVSLAGCATRPGSDALEVSLEPVKGAQEERILVATTRARAASQADLFTSKRASELDYGVVTVSVPPRHEPGEIEWPKSPPGNPQTDFVVRDAEFIDGNGAFRRALNGALNKGSGSSRSAFLFIHGYNTRFAEGVFRLAQIVADNKKAGNTKPAVPVLFSWASAGYITDYVYDINSVTLARDGLQKTLLDLARSDAKTITIVAHSLGNQLLLETLHQMKLEGIDLLKSKRFVVVMAAPDVDIDVFEYLVTSIGYRANPMFVLISRDDRALLISSELAGGKDRVGATENRSQLADLGVIVVDLTELDAPDPTNHVKFAELAQFGPDLQEALSAGQSNRNQDGLGGRLTSAGRSFTQFLSDTAKIVVTAPRAGAAIR